MNKYQVVETIINEQGTKIKNVLSTSDDSIKAHLIMSALKSKYPNFDYHVAEVETQDEPEPTTNIEYKLMRSIGNSGSGMDDINRELLDGWVIKESNIVQASETTYGYIEYLLTREVEIKNDLPDLC